MRLQLSAAFAYIIFVPALSCAVEPAPGVLASPAKQFPSPMVEHTRAHSRLKEEQPRGRREKLAVGQLFVPEKVEVKGKTPLFLHFHGGTWLPEVAAARKGVAVISIQLGSGSGVYSKAFADAKTFGELLKEAEGKAGTTFSPVVLTSWSAGYGAVREILKSPDHYERVAAVLLIDGLHAGYESGAPGPKESAPVKENLAVFVKLAQDAAAGRKQFLITHSEIFPGTYASTTETADYLLRELDLRRIAVLKWGPMGTQQLSETRRKGLTVVGYAGNSAPDHVDQLHALPDFLDWIDWK